MRTAKLLLGGCMFGDTLHIIPWLNKMWRDEGVTKLHWVTGTYAKTAIEFLQRFYDIEPHYFPDGSPGDFNDRYRFTKKYQNVFDSIEADIAVENVEETLCSGYFEPDRSLYLIKDVHLLDEPKENSIVIQPQTLHSWKNVNSIVHVDWRLLGCTIYTVGLQGECLIPGSVDMRSRPFFDVAKKIRSSNFAVTCSSAVACLTVYLQKPAIVCHPWDIFSFNPLSNIMKDVITPTPEQLLQMAREMLNEVQ